MSVESIMKARMKSHRMEELDRFNKSIPNNLQNYYYDDLIDSNWSGRITRLSAKMVKKYMDDPTSFLILMGGVGLGKTAMGIAICRKMLDIGRVRSALYVNVSTVLGEISFPKEDYDPISRIVSPDIILLDDVGAGTTALTDVRKNGIWSIIDQRWALNKLTIISTNLSLQASKNERDIMSLQEWFGDSAWDRINGNKTCIMFKGESLRKKSNRPGRTKRSTGSDI